MKTWGACVRKQRISQKMTALDLCHRLQISHPTLQRLENGGETVSVALYLAAFHILGVMESATPELRPDIWQMRHPAGRVRIKRGDVLYQRPPVESLASLQQ
ncbi:MAG: helix-turn-helix transcriptional regulator [Pseudomonadota bacterium]